MKRLFGLRKKKEAPPVNSHEKDVFGPTTLLLPNYKYILEFGPVENRSDSSLIVNALKDDKSGSMYAMKYIDQNILLDEEFGRRALKAAAHPYRRLSNAERRLVQFDQYGSLNSSLEDGGVKLLKGQWLIDTCCDNPKIKIPRRQELPSEAFLCGPVWDGIKILVVSHCWLSGEHPDPFGDRAQQLAEFVKFTQSNFPGYEVVLFWDWVSLLQHAPNATRGTIKNIQSNEDGSYSHLRVEFDENGDDGFIPPTLVESHLIPQVAKWGEHDDDGEGVGGGGNMLSSLRQLSTRSLSIVKQTSASTTDGKSGGKPSSLKKKNSIKSSSNKSKSKDKGSKPAKKEISKEEEALFTINGRVSARLPRTEEEEDTYQKAVESLHVWFGHRKCFKLVFTAHPKDQGVTERDYTERPGYDKSAWTLLESFFTSTSPQLVFDMNLVNTLPLSDPSMTFSLVNKLCCPIPKLLMPPEDFFEFIRHKYFTVKKDIELVVNCYCSFYQDWIEHYAVDEVSLVDVATDTLSAGWPVYLERILPRLASSLLSLNLSKNTEIDVSAKYFTQFSTLHTLLLSHTNVFGVISDFEFMKTLKRLDLSYCPRMSLGDEDIADMQCDEEGEEGGGNKFDFIFVSMDGLHFNFPISRAPESFELVSNSNEAQEHVST